MVLVNIKNYEKEEKSKILKNGDFVQVYFSHAIIIFIMLILYLSFNIKIQSIGKPKTDI